MICGPSTKKGIDIYLEKPGFPKSTLKNVDIWSRGYTIFTALGWVQGHSSITDSSNSQI